MDMDTDSARDGLRRAGAALRALIEDGGPPSGRAEVRPEEAGIGAGMLVRTALAARTVAGSRPPDETVRRAGQPQLLRWHIERAASPDEPNLYLHQLLTADSPVLHDHPWDSASLALEGGILESWAPAGGPAKPRRDSLCLPGRITLRPAALAHSLAPESPGHAWTLFATGPKVREWGFWPEGRFVPWRSHSGRAEARPQRA